MKPNRFIGKEEALEILKGGRYGVLSMVSAQGKPYGVPVNYFYEEEENALYFHCAVKGEKIDCMRKNKEVSFVVVRNEELIQKRFITHYESVLVRGIASFVTEERAKRMLLAKLCDVLVPEGSDRQQEVINKYIAAVMMVKIDIREISGKRNQDD